MVAPATVSTRAPATPATVTGATSSLANPATHTTVPKKSAPATEAARPATETAPDVPIGTERHPTTLFGMPPTAVPISVAQVSAVAAARAPRPASVHQP